MEKDLKNKPILAILPFDHRSYFQKLLGFEEPLTDEQISKITEYKQIVYQGYEQSLQLGVPKEHSAILVDDVFGFEILKDATQKGYTTLQSTEVSGKDYFEFEHGNDWQHWIDQVHPTYVKALVRYNPENNGASNQQSLAGLQKLSDYAKTQGYKFLIEPLIPASESQLLSVDNDKHRYDTEIRPSLTVTMIREMQHAGIEPDLWKIEGMFSESDYENVVTAAQENGRDHVGIIVLGRNETDETVALWLRTGSRVSGVVGFAVGRTIFLDALMKYTSQEITRDQAILEIAHRFKYFYNVFVE